MNHPITTGLLCLLTTIGGMAAGYNVGCIEDAPYCLSAVHGHEALKGNGNPRSRTSVYQPLNMESWVTLERVSTGLGRGIFNAVSDLFRCG